MPDLQLGERLTDVDVVQVPVEKLRIATKLLERSSVVELDRKTLVFILGDGHPLKVGRYVLVRNGVIAPSGSSLLDVHTRNSAVSLRHFFWRPVDVMFSIINFQVSRGSRQVYNVPLIVRTSRKVERAQAFCDFHH